MYAPSISLSSINAHRPSLLLYGIVEGGIVVLLYETLLEDGCLGIVQACTPITLVFSMCTFVSVAHY